MSVEPDAPTPPTPGGPPPIPWGSAALAPLAVFGLAWLVSTPPSGGARTPEVVAMDAALAEVAPEVVLVGNSTLQRGIDDVLLGQRLGEAEGIDGLDVVSLTVPASKPPAWFLLAKNRAFAAPKPPELIVAVAGSYFLTDNEHTEYDLTQLRYQAGPDDAPLFARVTGAPAMPPRLARLRDLADAALAVPRALLVGALFRDHAEAGWLEGGRLTADEAADEVLALENAIQGEDRAGTMPVAVQRASRAREEVPLGVDGSYLLDIARLARENGARFVVVQLPTNTARRADPVVLQGILHELGRLGAGFVDLTSLDLGPAAFFDAIHLSSSGRRIATEALAQGLVRIGALGDALEPARAPLVPAAVQRTRAPAPLPLGASKQPSEPCLQTLISGPATLWSVPRIRQRTGYQLSAPLLALTRAGEPMVQRQSGGAACDGTYANFGRRFIAAVPPEAVPDLALAWRDQIPAPVTSRVGPGDAYFLLPGAGLTWSFDGGPGGTVRVEAEVVPFGDAPVTLSVGEREVELLGDDVRVEAAVDVELPAGPWSLTLDGPEGGMVRRLVVGRDVIVRIGDTGVQDVKLTNPAPSELRITAQPPPDVAADVLVAHPAQRRAATAALPGMWRLSPSALRKAVGAGGDTCAPLRVTLDGAEVEGQSLPEDALLQAVGPAAQIVSGVATLVAPEGANPLTLPWRFTYREERACGPRLWVYPGDDVRVAFVVPERGRVSQLSLAGVGLGPARGRVAVTVRVDGAEAAARALAVAELEDETFDLPLSVPVTPGASEVEVRFTSTDDAPPVLFTTALLHDP